MLAFIAGLALVLVTAAAVPAAAQNKTVPGRRSPASGQRVKPAVPPRTALAGRPAVRAGLRRLRRQDTNHDRQISRDEFKGPARRFDRLDSNHDGLLSREDLQALRRNRQGAAAPSGLEPGASR